MSIGSLKGPVNVCPKVDRYEERLLTEQL